MSYSSTSEVKIDAHDRMKNLAFEIWNLMLARTVNKSSTETFSSENTVRYLDWKEMKKKDSLSGGDFFSWQVYGSKDRAYVLEKKNQVERLSQVVNHVTRATYVS